MKTGLLLVSALALSSVAHSAEDVDFKHSGEFRLRYTNDMNSTGEDSSTRGVGHRADTAARFKLNLSARRGEKFQAFLSVLHNSVFGNDSDTSPGKYSTAGANNLLLVNRAWGWWKATDALNFKVGRFGINIADGAVFSESDWDAHPTTFEGLVSTWEMDIAKLDLYLIKADELGTNPSDPGNNAGGGGAGNPSSDPERNFVLFSADLKNMPEMIKMANFHVLQVNKDETTAQVGSLPAGIQNFQHYGLTVGGNASNVLFKGTLAMQSGVWSKTAATDIKLNTNMFDLMVGYTMPETMGFKVTGAYHMDSGDESTTDDKQQRYQPLYYDAHSYSGLMDIIGWGNLSYFNLGASLAPAEDMEFGVGYFMYSRTTDKDTTVSTGGRTNIQTTGAANEKDLGSEINLFATKTYDNSFKIGAEFMAFMPGAFWKNGTPKIEKTLMAARLQASMSF